MHIETNVDARRSRQRTANGQPHDGAVASSRGFLATIASTIQSVVGGASRPPRLIRHAHVERKAYTRPERKAGQTEKNPLNWRWLVRCACLACLQSYMITSGRSIRHTPVRLKLILHSSRLRLCCDPMAISAATAHNLYHCSRNCCAQIVAVGSRTRDLFLELTLQSFFLLLQSNILLNQLLV